MTKVIQTIFDVPLFTKQKRKKGGIQLKSC